MPFASQILEYSSMLKFCRASEASKRPPHSRKLFWSSHPVRLDNDSGKMIVYSL
jgi:hypothetical protein